jgi:orotate phosphoribosyltransferase
MTDPAALLGELGVRRSGHFALSSGRHSDTYLQCAVALSQPRHALALGRALAERVEVPVDIVASPALGGVLAGFVVAAALGRPFVFAERVEGAFALRRGQAVEAGQRVLVVEDVVTTGRSALEVAALVEAAGATVAGVACIVDRSAGLPPGERPDPRPIALVEVAARTWHPGECPLCARGVQLDKPGSRPCV